MQNSERTYERMTVKIVGGRLAGLSCQFLDATGNAEICVYDYGTTTATLPSVRQ